MKRTKALVGLVVAGLWATSSLAANVTCPNTETDPPDPNAGNRAVTLTGVPTGTLCYDYGNGPESVNYAQAPGKGTNTTLDLLIPEWVVAGVNKGTLLVKNEDGVFVDKDGNPLGKFDFGLDYSEDGNGGTFSSIFTSSTPLVLLFKFGIANSPTNPLDPDWFAFYFPANSIISGGWSLDPASNFTGLSHLSLYTADGDEYLVPIPAAAWLLGSGLLGLFAIGRRRKGAQVAAA